jgi:hypothetical protein
MPLIELIDRAQKILVPHNGTEDFDFPVNLLGENGKTILSACRSEADLYAGIMAEIPASGLR